MSMHLDLFQVMTVIRRCETVVTAMGIALGATVRVAHNGAVGALASLGPISPHVALGVVASPFPSFPKNRLLS